VEGARCLRENLYREGALDEKWRIEDTDTLTLSHGREACLDMDRDGFELRDSHWSGSKLTSEPLCPVPSSIWECWLTGSRIAFNTRIDPLSRSIPQIRLLENTPDLSFAFAAGLLVLA